MTPRVQNKGSRAVAHKSASTRSSGRSDLLHAPPIPPVSRQTATPRGPPSPPSLFPDEDDSSNNSGGEHQTGMGPTRNPGEDEDDPMAEEQDAQVLEIKRHFCEVMTDSEGDGPFSKLDTTRMRFLPRVIGPHVNVLESAQIGMRGAGIIAIDADDELVNDVQAEHFDLSLRAYKNMIAIIPNLSSILTALKDDTQALDRFACFVEEKAKNGRGTDVHLITHNILSFISAVEEDLVEGIKEIKKPEDYGTFSKDRRGWGNHLAARLLCPRADRKAFDEDRDRYCREIFEGLRAVTADDLPSFLYPQDEPYEKEHPERGLLKNPQLWFRALFPGLHNKTTATSSRSGRKSSSQRVAMSKVIPEHIAYACALYRYGLSSQPHWAQFDCDFSNEEFWRNIVLLFDDEGVDEWAKSTLDWWNVEIFGIGYRRNGTSLASSSGGFAALHARRAARHAAGRSTALVGDSAPQ